jgi:recombinational DNA repair protein RecR
VTADDRCAVCAVLDDGEMCVVCAWQVDDDQRVDAELDERRTR